MGKKASIVLSKKDMPFWIQWNKLLIPDSPYLHWLSWWLLSLPRNGGQWVNPISQIRIQKLVHFFPITFYWGLVWNSCLTAVNKLTSTLLICTLGLTLVYTFGEGRKPSLHLHSWGGVSFLPKQVSSARLSDPHHPFLPPLSLRNLTEKIFSNIL